jgi:two-component system sensor histidine kinase KdpD
MPDVQEETAGDAVRRLQEELIAAQRQGLLGGVATLMAHEFNNLMTPVLARAQDSVQRDDVAAMRKALQVTVAQTQKAIDITRRLLELASGRRTSPGRCQVRAAVDDAIAALVRPVAKDGIELVVDVPDELTVLAEPALLTQTLLSVLTWSRENLRERSGRIAIRAVREGGSVAVEIENNGTGMSPDQIESVIAPLLAADVAAQPDDRQGAGLALNMCRTIVQLHGGRASARQREGSGCIIRVEWPAA